MDTYQYDLVQKLSFIRFGGTEDELRAANIILEEITKAGGEGALENFTVPAYSFQKYSVAVTAPYEQELEVLPWGLSGSFPAGGVDLKFFYAEDCSEAALYGIKDLSDTVVLVNDLKLDAYKALCEKKAAAILVISGKWYQSKENHDFVLRHIRPALLTFGKIPTFFVWAKDATELVRLEAETLHIELEQEEFENTSRNVVATVPGTQIPEESIVITAHYDSVTVGTGSWDNATGSATILYLYKYFLAHPPKRTLRFVWCGSEEQGLLGSKAYVEAHADLVEKEVKFCFNFDMCGTVLGPNTVFVTGGEDLKHYAEAFCKEYGLNATLHQDVHSSDSAPFSDKGIPALGLSRGTRTAEIHTRNDLMYSLSAKQLKKDGDFSISFIERVANSARLPIGVGMPEDMKEKLDKYFQRDKLPKEDGEKKQ